MAEPQVLRQHILSERAVNERIARMGQNRMQPGYVSMNTPGDIIDQRVSLLGDKKNQQVQVADNVWININRLSGGVNSSRSYRVDILTGRVGQGGGGTWVFLDINRDNTRRQAINQLKDAVDEFIKRAR